MKKYCTKCSRHTTFNQSCIIYSDLPVGTKLTPKFLKEVKFRVNRIEFTDYVFCSRCGAEDI